MQAVILAAGKGTRMQALTSNTPKPLLQVAGKSLIERNVAILPSEVDELIIVVGYLSDQVKEYLGDEFIGRKVTYVHQEEPLGTAHALSLCEEYITGRFLVLMGDDLYSKEDVRQCLLTDRAWLVKKVRDNFTGGRIAYDSDGNVQNVEEGEHLADEAYVNVNMFVLTPEYFQYDYTSGAFTAHNGETEYGLPQVVAKMAADYPIKMVEATNWHQVTNKEDLEVLSAHFTSEEVKS